MVPRLRSVGVVCRVDYSLHSVVCDKDQIVLNGDAHYPQIVFLNSELFACCALNQILNTLLRKPSATIPRGVSAK